jgi:hypothetical protein
MSDSPATTTRAAAAPPKSREDQRTPSSGPVERRPSLHDHQRELVRASLIARPPAGNTTRLN